MAHPDLEQLFSMLLEHSRQLLNKNREMYPIAASMSRDAQITPIAAYSGDEHPKSQTVIDELSLLLVSLASPEKTAALGLAYDVRFAKDKSSPKRDAIKIDLEHAEGDCLAVIVPYHWSDQAIELEEPFAEAKPPRWFGAQHDAP